MIGREAVAIDMWETIGGDCQLTCDIAGREGYLAIRAETVCLNLIFDMEALAQLVTTASEALATTRARGGV
jgi:hypothetical protein